MSAIQRHTISQSATVMTTAALAWALKHHYSQAGADDLRWVLAPTCWLTAALGGIDLVAERGAGFISHRYHMVVGPACAGLNFLIIAMLALFLSYQVRFASLLGKLSWLAQCLGIAYGATLLTNSCRILLAAHLYNLDIYSEWLTPEGLHRFMGTVIYCVALFALCAAGGRWIVPQGLQPRSSGRLLWAVPTCCYLGITVGVPLMNRAFLHDPGRFAAHTALVVAVCAAVAGLTALARIAMARGRKWVTCEAEDPDR